MKAILYRADGTQEEVKPENGTDFQLKELYRLLDCETIEDIRLGDSDPEYLGALMIGDEEGRLKEGRLENKAATAIYRKSWGIKEPLFAWLEHQKALEEVDAIIAMPEPEEGEEPFNIVGNVLVCPDSMLQ